MEETKQFRKKCQHNKKFGYCELCSDSNLCSHKIDKYKCSDCDPSILCQHQKFKYRCVECGVGGSICIHKKRKDCCRECGNSYCQHGKQYNRCQICDENKWLAQKMRYRLNKAIKRQQKKEIEYLGCSMQQFRQYIQQQFVNNMDWDNYGNIWTIDHIQPLNPKDINLTKEQLIQRFHYTNTQPLFKKENLSKGNKAQAKRFTNIQQN